MVISGRFFKCFCSDMRSVEVKLYLLSKSLVLAEKSAKKRSEKMTRLGLDPRTLSESVMELLTIRDNQLHHPANC